MKNIDAIAGVLVLVGAINWGLVGVANFNLVAALFGTTVISSIVYALVGLAGLYLATRAPAMLRQRRVLPAVVR